MSAVSHPGDGGIRARLQLARPGFLLDADLALPALGVSALFGPSGCGKTTCLRVLAGLEPASTSRIDVGGTLWEDIATRRFTPPHRRPVGYVAQQTRLFPHLDLARNLQFGMARVPERDRRLRLAPTVEALGLGALMHRRPHELSGGELQRAGIARALVTSPRLLLLDEPLAALDAERKAELMPYLERLHRWLDIPMIYVTHAPDEVARLADHLVLMEAGRVIASGPVAEVLASGRSAALKGDRAGALVRAVVAGYDPHYQLLELAFDGGRLFLTGAARPIGEPVRLFVQARDVSLARSAAADSSVLNMIEATVSAIDDDAPGQKMVRLDAAGAMLLARVTHRSCESLGLAPGQRVFAYVKGVAIVG